MILATLNLMALFGVFAAVCARLYGTGHPRSRTFCGMFQWSLWLAVHLAIGMPMLVLIVDQIVYNNEPKAAQVVFRFALAVLLLAPWRRRKDEL